jgi:hypothetical protein
MRMIEVWIVPERRGSRSGCIHEALVFGIGDLSGGEEEGIDPDAMNGTFAILPGGGAHEEPGGGDGDE